jgi:RNA polymerase sigma-70 factor (ECF subfamily)
MDAEDALSRAMLRAKDKLTGRAWEIKNLRAWLTTLTYHVCMDIHRERAKGKSELESMDRLKAGVAAGGAYAESPESSFIRAEVGAQLRTLINALPAKLRAPFILRFLHDLEYAEIAERLGLTPATVRKRIQLARMRLKAQLNKQD